MPSLFQELFDVSVDAFSKSSIPRKLWRGKEKVYAIDGSKIQLPNSDSNFKQFGEMFSKKHPEKRWSLEEFNGATSISIEQEFFIHLLYANLASLVKVAADTQIDDNANPDNKYRYQANRAYIIGRMKDILVPVICNEREMSEFDTLFRSACKFRSQIQPGRNTPRKRIKNDRTHFRNRKTAV